MTETYMNTVTCRGDYEALRFRLQNEGDMYREYSDAYMERVTMEDRFTVDDRVRGKAHYSECISRTDVDKQGVQAWLVVCDLLDHDASLGWLCDEVTLIAQAAAGLTSIQVRDAVLLYALSGDISAFSLVDTEELGERLEQAWQCEPSFIHTLNVLTLVRVACIFAGDNNAPLLSVCGYLAWWLGDFREAIQFIHRAVQSDSRYSLAILLQSVVAYGVLPPWMTKRK